LIIKKICCSESTRFTPRFQLYVVVRLERSFTIFGIVAVSPMLVCYAFKDRILWFIFAFAVACALGSIYGFLQSAWPIRCRRGDLVDRRLAPLVDKAAPVALNWS